MSYKNAPGRTRTNLTAASGTPIPEERGTESGTVDVKKSPEDFDLAVIVDRWPHLSEATRSAIVAIVRAVAGDAK